MTTPNKDLSPLEENLGVQFDHDDLLRQALTHRSYLNENPEFSLDHNERLEFLGDAVLELVVTDHLYHHFTDMPEGEMTNLRSAVVRGEMLSKVASELGIETFILLSKGEQQDTGKARDYILANTMEAVIGAIYEDQGYEAAKQLIDNYIITKLDEVIERDLHIDAKSKFQELAQEQFRLTPSYEVLQEDGLDHEKQFTIGAFIGDEEYGRGTGTSKQEAQQEAARSALKKLEAS